MVENTLAGAVNKVCLGIVDTTYDVIEKIPQSAITDQTCALTRGVSSNATFGWRTRY